MVKGQRACRAKDEGRKKWDAARPSAADLRFLNASPGLGELLQQPLGMGLPVAAHLSDVLAHVLDHHLVGSNGLHGKEPPVVNVALAEF